MSKSPSPVAIRRAVPGDAEALYALSLASIRQSAASHYTGAQLEAWAARRSVEGHRRLIEQTATFVARDLDTGAVAGFASVALVPTEQLERGEVDQLFVAPDYGGRGIAGLLLRAVETAARDTGVFELVTHASWRAVPVFERRGYRRVEVESVRVDDQVLTRARMRKTLEPRG